MRKFKDYGWYVWHLNSDTDKNDVRIYEKPDRASRVVRILHDVTPESYDEQWFRVSAITEETDTLKYLERRERTHRGEPVTE